jgi:rRNA maturation endonuclease Nob1
MNAPINLVLLPLRSAVLCVDCNTVSSAPGNSCPACGSPSLMSLSAVLDRKPAKSVSVELEVAHA